MKYGHSGIDAVLMGHCPHCHEFGHFHFYDEDTYDPDVNYRSRKSIPGAECVHCGNVFTAVNDGHQCLACEPVVVAQPKPVHRPAPVCSPPPVRTRQCFHCGMQRAATARFCPHCRLDEAGRPADVGIGLMGLG